MSPQRLDPPRDLEAEQGALGAAMLTPEALTTVLVSLAEEDFYRPTHRTIFRALATLHARSVAVDATTVGSELTRTRALADVGGAPFLHTLVAGVPTAAHVGEYVATVAELAALRRVMDAGHQLAQVAVEARHEPARALTLARKLLEGVLADQAGNGTVSPRLLAGLRNGAWLDAQDFPPLAYAVPGVIPEGSVLLVGPPKIGKSWFVLAVALAAASGGRVLGQEVAKQPVLYLALEDGDRRMQDRCRKLLAGDPIPPGFEYLTRVEPGRVLETIGVWLAHHSDQPPLVVLDTLGKVMPPALMGESSYQRDYRVGTALKHLADERPGMTMLVNHHDRKAGAEDFIDSVSGTHGLAGAADTVVVLTRARHEEGGRLKVTGRDVPEGEYVVRFVNGSAWVLDGADLAEASRRATEARMVAGLGDRSAEVIAYVQQHPEGVRPPEVAAALGLEQITARVYLTRAVDTDRLRRPQRGLYAPATSVTSVTSAGERARGDVTGAVTSVTSDPALPLTEVTGTAERHEPLTRESNTSNSSNSPPGGAPVALRPRRLQEAHPVSDQQPLAPAQRQTAAELPWYRAWLLATGRTQAELEPESDLQRRDDLP